MGKRRRSCCSLAGAGGTGGALCKVAILLALVAVLVVLHVVSIDRLCPIPLGVARDGGRAQDDTSAMVELASQHAAERDEEEGEEHEREEDEEEDGLEDEITFLFAIINMDRRDHLGIANYTFERDYLEQVRGFLRTYRPERMQIIVQSRYYAYLEDLIYDGVDVRFVETEDLRRWPYYESVERIRRSEWWIASTPWLANVPQGYSDLYNPIVMHKLLWLRDLAVKNPFKTRYFVWLDSGGICTPRINNNILPVPDFKAKARYYMDKMFVTLTPYVMGKELHGCYREAMLKITHDQSPSHIVKGWLMGGNRKSLEKVARLYNYVLNKSLELGCLGTEETLLTMAYYRRPELFHVHHNVEDRSDPAPITDDVCYFLWPDEPVQGVPETPLERYERLQRIEDSFPPLPSEMQK